ncbi:MAG: tyrosine-protein phosphatase [Erysipelotrichaceae bacterium]|nr:tyrosine-protein phosphatase [Erysipelotrichaceae bacterium]
MKKQRFLGIVSLSFFLFSCASKNPLPTIDILKPEAGETVAVLDAGAEQYLALTSSKEEASYLSTYSGLAFYDTQRVSFSWKAKSSGHYRLTFSEKEDLSSSWSYEVDGNTFDEYTAFVPGQRYFWKVELGKGDADSFVPVASSLISSFETTKDTLRPIGLEGAWNVRDIGGWLNEEGERTSYRQIYRGSRLNGVENASALTDNGKKTLQTLGIRTEIDLRTPNQDDSGQDRSVIEGAKYVKAPMMPSCMIFPFYEDQEHSRQYDPRTATSLQQIFEALGDPSSYPVYIHCNAGADRTGTLLYLIEGLLGWKEEDLIRDFELTSFSRSGKRWRSSIDPKTGDFSPDGVMQDDGSLYVAFGKMNALMKEHYGNANGSIKEAIERYLTTEFNISSNQIETLRKMLLEKNSSVASEKKSL